MTTEWLFSYVNRCDDAMSGWAAGINQDLPLDQDCTATVKTPDVASPYTKSCGGASASDNYSYCFNVLKKGYSYCDKEKSRVPAGTMAKCCMGACGCKTGSSGCLPADNNGSCNYWAKRGECTKNPLWMWKNCATSCKTTC